MSDQISEYVEAVVSTAPFVVRRRVQWSDCDPAGVVHTARFPAYVLSGYEALMRHLAAQEDLERFRFGLPVRAMAFDFRRGLWPHQMIDMRWSVTAIRTRTFDLLIEAEDAGGESVFVARLTPIAMAEGERRAAPLVPALRAALEGYQAACAPGRPP